MKKIIQQILSESLDVKDRAVTRNMDNLVLAAKLIAGRLAGGHKIMLFGNGGSAADAQHIAAEFVNRLAIERPPLAAMALTTDTSILTSIGNDYNFNEIFSKQIRALGQKNDIALGISTSGNSTNVLKAFEAARETGIFTLGMTGCGGKIEDLADMVLTVASDVTVRIQETHICMGHILCELVDRILFPGNFNDKESINLNNER